MKSYEVSTKGQGHDGGTNTFVPSLITSQRSVASTGSRKSTSRSTSTVLKRRDTVLLSHHEECSWNSTARRCWESLEARRNKHDRIPNHQEQLMAVESLRNSIQWMVHRRYKTTELRRAWYRPCAHHACANFKWSSPSSYICKPGTWWGVFLLLCCTLYRWNELSLCCLQVHAVIPTHISNHQAKVRGSLPSRGTCKCQVPRYGLPYNSLICNLCLFYVQLREKKFASGYYLCIGPSHFNCVLLFEGKTKVKSFYQYSWCISRINTNSS